MLDTPWCPPAVSAGGVFALAFVGCLVGLPIAGFALGGLLAPVGLGAVAAVAYIPAFAFWLGSLRIGPWGDARWVHDGYHVIPLAVWLVTWAVFAATARNLNTRWQVGVAISVIVAVTIGMQLGLAALDIWLVIEVL
ncbi:hypothetical protein [Gemmata massiliana]|uniref:hypothetical protein n=1 Tax=Gemmata massiliana TaxID=1210884 RepID=UPI0013A696BF|nr:hypothetical protein [Gemmata massiliana]